MHLREEPVAIQSYCPGSIVIKNSTYTHSVILTPDQLYAHWKPQSIEVVTTLDLNEIIVFQPQCVVLGTGSRLKIPAPHVLDFFKLHAFPLECMDTRSACGAYIVLASEGRSVLGIFFL